MTAGTPEGALDGGTDECAANAALLAALRSLADQFGGSLGVALAAAELTDSEVLVRRLTEAAASAAQEETPLPEGEYARVEIMGHDYHTGWVTERDRAGVRVLVIADWDGRVLAEVPGQSLYRYVPLPTPLKRPDERTALPPAGGSDDYSWNDEPFGEGPF